MAHGMMTDFLVTKRVRGSTVEHVTVLHADGVPSAVAKFMKELFASASSSGMWRPTSHLRVTYFTPKEPPMFVALFELFENSTDKEAQFIWSIKAAPVFTI